MKTPSFHFCLPGLLLICLAAPAGLRADPSAPLFGGASLTIHDSTFTLQSAQEGTRHHDTYTASGHSVTVSGLIGFHGLVTVSGTRDAGTVDGHLSDGAYAGKRTRFPVNRSSNGSDKDVIAGASLLPQRIHHRKNRMR